ncbi:ankyrin repeat domain-containing protein [Spiroplasma endosymbiont of Nephrotoma flavescens]|uniref:ankyrin repeat domain-containing protein n=1 Tax=Spiroplasma endosymbiont of Nephrotoma flavescens TaxID=3066302 RepID=UPI00313CE7A9
MYDFIYNNQDIINEIFKKENENYKIIKAVGDLFDKPQNQKFSDIKIEILNYIQKQLELRKFLGKLYNMINIKQININENQLIYNIGINKNQENFLLVISVYQKNLDIIKLLINLIPKSEMINGNSNDFFSPLNIALALRHTEIVKELLKHKNINVNKTEPICHMSVLHNAVRLGETEIVKELLKNPEINVNITAINDITPLHLAVILDKNEIVTELLKHPKINVNAIVKKDYTIPFLKEVFDKLNHSDIDINLKEKIKLTPLFFAEFFGKTQIAEELLKHPKINTDSSLKKIIPNLLEAEMEKHFNSEEFEKEFEKILKNKIKLCNELLEKVQDEQQKNKIIKSLEETKNALKELKEPKRNEKLDKEKQETEENKKISEEIIKKLEEDINSKEFEEKIKKIFISDLNKYFKENNELKEFPKIMQNYRNLTKEKQNELVKELVEIKLWDFIIINRNLGEIADNSEQTILKHVRELNPKLDFLKKIKITNINITTALITSNDENCPGGVIVTFTLAKKASKPSKTQKTITKDESDFGGFKRGFLNSSSKSNSNINTNAGGSQSQGSSSKRVSVGEQAGTSGTQNQNTKTTNQNNLYDVPADNSCLFWSVATSYLLPARNNNEEFRNRFIQLLNYTCKCK